MLSTGFFRSLLFSTIFYLWILVAMLLALPVMVSYSAIYKLNSLWAGSVMWLFRKIVGCDYRIEGLENLPQNSQGFVIASKHQSAWETIILFKILPKVCYVYKKELGYIPIYGWYNIRFNNIRVDRGSGGAALRKIVSQAIERVKDGYQVVIFPQGSRTPFGKEVKYKPAIYAMYREGLPVYPAALNSGNHWPKNGLKHPGTIVMKFLPQIEPGLDREQFMSRLEAAIEVESNALHDKDNNMHGRGCACH